MVLKPAFLIATLLWASAVAAHSKIYTYVDADGQRHYTDVPDNNAHCVRRIGAAIGQLANTSPSAHGGRRSQHRH